MCLISFSFFNGIGGIRITPGGVCQPCLEKPGGRGAYVSFLNCGFVGGPENQPDWRKDLNTMTLETVHLE